MNKKIQLAIGVVIGLVLLALIGGAVVVLMRGSSAKKTLTAAPPTVEGKPAEKTGSPVVYTSDFTQGNDAAWSTGLVDQTPSGAPFLGQFANEDVNFKIAQLPAHAFVRIKFDLYIINTWDGNSDVVLRGGPNGPDFIEVDMQGGPNLLRATFSNLPDSPYLIESGKVQSFPSPIPSAPNKAGTGSSSMNKLGYIFDFHQPGAAFPMDTVYSINMTLPHTADSMQLNFAAFNLTSLADEGWGIANVKVEVLQSADVPVPNDAALAAAWAALLGDDPTAARKAFWDLVAGGDATVKFIQKTAGGFGIDPGELKSALAGFGNNDQSAVEKLKAMGPVIEPALRKAVDEDPMLVARVTKLLQDIERSPLEYPQDRKAAAASRVLDVINTAESTRLREKLLTAPVPVMKPGTPEYEADWKHRFDVVYHLERDEAVKYIPPPFIPERQAFVKQLEQNQKKQGGGFGPIPNQESKSTMLASTENTLHADRSVMLIPSGLSFGWVRGTGIRRAVELLSRNIRGNPDTIHRVDLKPEYDKLDLPGDWIIRPGTTQEQILAAVTKAVETQHGRKIRFDLITIQEDAVVVRGKYAWHEEGAGDPKDVVQVFADRRDPEGRASDVVEMRLSDMFRNLHALGYRFIDETDSKATEMKFQFHGSSFQRPPGADRITPERLQQVLDHLAKQTSLTYTIEKRPLEVYVGSDAQ